MIKILIIEDDSVDFMAMSRMLDKLETEIAVTHVKTKAEAVEKLSTESYDCVILDYVLPDGNGLDILEYMEAEGIAATVILATSQSDHLLATKAIQKGAQNYFPKDHLNSDENVFLQCVLNALEMTTLTNLGRCIAGMELPKLNSLL